MTALTIIRSKRIIENDFDDVPCRMLCGSYYAPNVKIAGGYAIIAPARAMARSRNRKSMSSHGGDNVRVSSRKAGSSLYDPSLRRTRLVLSRPVLSIAFPSLDNDDDDDGRSQLVQYPAFTVARACSTVIQELIHN